METAVRTEGVTKTFGVTGTIVAVDHVDLTVPTGTFFGFVGPNGAGKTTMVNLLTGLLRPTSGRIEVLGRTFDAHSLEIKRRIGLVPEGLNLYEQLTGEEYLYFVGRMYGLSRDTLRMRRDELFALMDLEGDRHRYVYEYSSGMRKKLALAASLIHDPDLLFLDEPFEGIDPLTLRAIRRTLTQIIARGKTIFLTSHLLEIVERLCSEVAIIHRGRIVFRSPTAEVRARMSEEGTSSLEEVFVELVAGEEEERSLSWLRE